MDDYVGTTDWNARAANLALPPGQFIGGTFEPGEASRAFVSPRNGSVLGDVSWAGVKEADAAVTAARRAFDDGPWSRLHPRERGRILQAFASLVDAHRDELALLVSLEMGKPIRVAYEIELRALITTLRYYGELADKEFGEIPPTDADALALVTREPAGVVAAVVPWNFPLTIGGWKFAPALAAGCTVVLKTAEQSPLSMLRVAALGVEAGLPPGVFNVLTGDGITVGRHLGEHPDVDILTFTGSTAVGRHFLRYSADSNLKRVYLELGGKSPNIIFSDAPDLAQAADMAAWAIFFNSGEMCTAGSRLVVQRQVADEVVERVAAAASTWVVGDPFDPATQMGPLGDERSMKRVLAQLEEGTAAGATIRAGGARLRPEADGPYLAPTVVTDLAHDNVLVRDELFAPVLSVLVVDDEEEALRVAGDTPYGLAAGVWTNDLGRAHRAAKRLKAGTVWVNCYEEGDLSVPFGGVKLSGSARDKSRHALAQYSDLKTTWIVHG